VARIRRKNWIAFGIKIISLGLFSVTLPLVRAETGRSGFSSETVDLEHMHDIRETRLGLMGLGGFEINIQSFPKNRSLKHILHSTKGGYCR